MSRYSKFLEAARSADDERDLGDLKLAEVAERASMTIEEARQHLEQMFREGLVYNPGGWRDCFLFVVEEEEED